MNNWKRCDNGHFYDGDKYMVCPYCSQTATGADVTVSAGNGTMMRTPEEVEESGEEGRTVSLHDAVNAAANMTTSALLDDNKTVSYYSDAIGTEPVVGWLVCITGEYFGESFKLKAGRNFIGRASNMDVVLGGDTTVSRERHGIIVYVPRNRMFIAQPGESRELFYVNDKAVLDNVQMKDNDIIDIGNTRLMLVTCCNEHFCWEDITKEDKS